MKRIEHKDILETIQIGKYHFNKCHYYSSNTRPMTDKYDVISFNHQTIHKKQLDNV